MCVSGRLRVALGLTEKRRRGRPRAHKQQNLNLNPATRILSQRHAGREQQEIKPLLQIEERRRRLLHASSLP